MTRMRHSLGARLVAGAVAWSEAVLGQTGVIFPDPNLEAAVRADLKKTTGDLSIEDLRALSLLSAGSRGITNLLGVEWATNLVTFDGSQNRISDLSPLAGLNRLSYLDVSYNRARDLSPLKGLTNLYCLILGGWPPSNPFYDLSPLIGLGSLQVLWISGDPRRDYSGLSALTSVWSLTFDLATPAAVGYLTGLTNLTELSIFSWPTQDVHPLLALTNWTSLTPWSDQVWRR